ncbi:helix-turn-helix transcriptional regulator [Nevskia soli]|uniref:helix-turn-helix transcriptional regulator n=1 Tax=Nevskia soli TaxID=418856 RepID=UPI0004A70AD6|nr:AraC family transcriptional regulator [Nevskia soli]
MAAKSPEVPARYYARLCELLGQDGVNVSALLKAARIRPAAVRAPDAVLRLNQVEMLLDEMFRLTRRQDQCHDLGRALKLSSHSIVGYGMLSSPTVGYAMTLAARYFRLIMPSFRMRFRVDAELAEIEILPVLPMSRSCLQFHLEAIAVALHWEIRELLKNQMPDYELYLSIAAPPHKERYNELVEARCHFGWQSRPGLRMQFPAAVAQRTPALADLGAVQMAERRCNEQIRGAIAQGKVGDWMRMMLREASDGWPGLTELAQTLNLSPRTLDRYLKKEGESFRALSNRTRHEKALELLDDGRLTITHIAHELGYTDMSNFARSFRREAGVAPGDYRSRRAGRARPC